MMEDLNRRLEQLHIRRDAFLNHMIGSELLYLREEMQGKRLSSKARRYVSGELKRLVSFGSESAVNIVVDTTTADALNALVKDTNMVRDAFINRLILFLRSTDSLLDHLRLPKTVRSREFESGVPDVPTSPLRAIEDAYADPLFYLRIAANERHECGLYLLPLPPKLQGFTCYIEDKDVPGTDAHAEAEREAKELAVLLAEFDSAEFNSGQRSEVP